MSNEVKVVIAGDSAGLEAAARRGTQAVSNMGGSLDGTRASTDALTASFARMGQVAAGALGAGEVMRAADAWSNLNSRLALVTAGSAEAAVAYDRVVKIAMATRMGLEEVGSVYEKFARQSADLGLSGERIANLTTTIAQAMTISGASAQSAQASLLQFGQALSSGALRGDELNSVIEQSPRLAQALADGLGVPIGKLKELGEAGKLTSEQLVAALEGQAGRLEAEFARMPVTIGGALTNIKTAWTDTVGSFEQGTGVFRTAAGGLQVVAANMDLVAGATGAVAAVMTGRFVSSLAAGTAAKVASAQAARQLAAAEMEAALSSQAAAAAQIRAAGVYGASQKQIDALAAANTRLATAQTAAAATGRLASAVGMLGGPIGIVTTALTLGATAWILWGDSAKKAANDAKSAMAEAQEEAAKLGKDTLDYARSRRDVAQARYSESGMRTGSVERADFSKWDNIVKELETRERNIAERNARMASTVSDKWSEMYSTQAEKRKQAIDKLDAAYAKEVAAANGNQERILALTADYQRKRAVLENEFGAKSAAGAAQVAKEMLDNRLKAISAGVDHEKALLDQAHASGLKTEYEYQEGLYAAAVAGLSKRAAALQSQLDSTKGGADRQKLIGDLQAVQAEVSKAADAWTLARIKMTNSSSEFLKEQQKENDEIDKRLQRAREELEEIGLTAEQKDKLAQAANLAAAAQQEEAAAAYEAGRAYSELTGNAESVAFYEKVRDGALTQAKALRDLASIEAQQGAKRAAVAAAEESKKAWDKFSDDIERSLTDSIYRGLEKGGRDGAKAALDVIKSTLKAIPIKIAVQAVVDPIMGGIRSMMGGGGTFGTSVATGSSMFNAGSSAYSLWNGGYSSAFNQFATSAAGQALGLGTSLTAATWNAGIAAGTTAGLGTGTAMAGLGATGTSAAGLSATAGSAGATTAGVTSFGSTIATALPWAAAAIAAYSLLSSEGGGPKTEGGINANISGGAFTGFQELNVRGEKSMTGDSADEQIKGILQPLSESIISMARQLGGTLDDIQLGLAYNTDPAGSAPDNIGGAIYDADTGAIKYQHIYNSGRGDYAQQLAVETQRMMLAALQQTDLSDWADKIVDAMDPLTATADQLSAAFARLNGMSQLVPILEDLGLGAEDVSESLIASMGGFDAAAASLSSYYDNYFTAEEKSARLRDQVTEQLAAINLTMPASVEAFRGMVEEAGPEAFAVLMRVQGAFKQIANEASTTEVTIRQSAQAFGSAWRSEMAALNATRAAAAEAVRSSQKSMLDGVVTAWKNAKDTLRETINTMDQFTAQMDDLRRSVAVGQAGVGGINALAIARADLDAVGADAATGDESAIGRLSSVVGDYLAALNATAVSKLDLEIGTARALGVIGAAQKYTTGRATDAAQDLTTIDARYLSFGRSLQQSFANVPAYAAGGSHAGGWAIVGDGGGPELVNMAPGRVYSNGDSKALLDLSPVVNKLDIIERRLAAVETHTKNTAGVLDGTRPQGAPLLTEAA